MASLTFLGATLLVGALTLSEANAAARHAVGSESRPLRHVLRLDGGSALGYEATPRFASKEGAFTVELRVRGTTPRELATVVGCRHYGGFGITWSHPKKRLDRPTGWVNVESVPGAGGPGYLLLRPTYAWRWERWTHIALSWDGRVARLFVDGRLAAEAVGRRFRPSRLPLFVGADTDGDGQPVQRFTGEIDDVRVSDTARYTADFAPPADLTPDDRTTLLLDFDDPIDPFADRSRHRRIPRLWGSPIRVTVR